ncbi:PEP-CTERM sorting domain-containing protein [Microcoleus sp. AR_TQ3_B6]
MKEKNQIPLNLKIKVHTMKFPLNLVKSLLAVASVAAVSAVSAAPASAFNFSNIASGDTVGDAYANNFGFTLEDQGGLAVFNIFNFGNSSANSMFIAGVFFDDNGSLSSSSTPWANVNNVGEVAFTGGASNAQFPQGGNNFSTDYAFFSNNGAGNAFGIQAGEKLGLAFAANYNNVLTALNDGSLKIGLHVQALPNGASDSYISSNSGNTENTPEPLTMLAAGAAVGFGTMFKKQRAQAQKAE